MYGPKQNILIGEGTYMRIGEDVFQARGNFYVGLEKKLLKEIIQKKGNPDIFKVEDYETLDSNIGRIKVRLQDILIEN
ncbi:MAG: hypothetical protein WC850_06375 [Candidatus Gracilibacteria bacterium]